MAMITYTSSEMDMTGMSTANSSLLLPQPILRDCDGSLKKLGVGTWIGHAVPGAFFLFWGFWWAWHSFRRHVRLGAGSYRSLGSYPEAGGGALAFLEPLLKLAAPFVGILVELRLDHDRFLWLFCSEGSFSPLTVHNYQHAASYPAFGLSGLVDLLALRVALPKGTQKAFLALAFVGEALLMTLHKKHAPVDALVHLILAGTMWLCALGAAAEAAVPRSFGASALRAWAACLQGTWMIHIGQMMYTGVNAWTHNEHSSVMMVPVALVMYGVLLAACLLALYVALQTWEAHRAQQKGGRYAPPGRHSPAEALQAHAAPRGRPSPSQSSASDGDDELEMSRQASSRASSGARQLPHVSPPGHIPRSKMKGDHLV